MSITIEPWLATLFSTLTGMEWPKADESALRGAGDDYQKLAAELPKLKDYIADLVNVCLQRFEGETADAFVASMRELIGQTGGSDHLGQAVTQATDLAQTAHDTANQVEYAKWMTIAQLVQLVGEIAAAMYFAPLTFGASLANLSWEYAFTREAVVAIMQWLIRTIIGHTVLGVLGANGLDAAIQLIQFAQGNRHSWDASASKQAFEFGLIGGVTSGPLGLVGMGLGKALGSALGKSAGSVLGHELGDVMRAGADDVLKAGANDLLKVGAGDALKAAGRWPDRQAANAFAKDIGGLLGATLPQLQQGFKEFGKGSIAEAFQSGMARRFEQHLGDVLGKETARQLGSDFGRAFAENWGRAGADHAALNRALRDVLEHGGVGQGGVRALADSLPELADHMKANKLFQLGQAVGEHLNGGIHNSVNEGLYNLIFSDDHKFSTSWGTFGSGVAMGVLGGIGHHLATPVREKFHTFVRDWQQAHGPDGDGKHYGPLHPLTLLSVAANLTGHPVPFPVSRPVVRADVDAASAHLLEPDRSGLPADFAVSPQSVWTKPDAVPTTSRTDSPYDPHETAHGVAELLGAGLGDLADRPLPEPGESIRTFGEPPVEPLPLHPPVTESNGLREPDPAPPQQLTATVAGSTGTGPEGIHLVSHGQDVAAARPDEVRLTHLGAESPPGSDHGSDAVAEQLGGYDVVFGGEHGSADPSWVGQRFDWLDKVNPYRDADAEARTNCVLTAIATDLSLAEGVGHQAPPSAASPAEHLANYQGRAPIPVGSYRDLVGLVHDAGPGARGLVVVGKTGEEVGHVFNVVHDESGRVVFLDGQTGGPAHLEADPGRLEFLPTSDHFDQAAMTGGSTQTGPLGASGRRDGALPGMTRWRLDSGLTGKRSPELMRVDDALAAYHRADGGPASTDTERLAQLSALKDSIESWQKGKRAYTGAPVDSERAKAVARLAAAVDREGLRLTLNLRDRIPVGPEPAHRYDDLAVYAAGAMTETDGAFRGASAYRYAAAKESLGGGADEVDIRLHMLGDQIRQAYADFRPRKEADPQTLGLFTAPEWYFKRPQTPFTLADKEKITTGVLELSAQCPGMVIVPGSTVWAEPGSGVMTVKAGTVVVMNGRTLHETTKMKEGFDTVGYGPGRDERQGLSAKDQEAGRALNDALLAEFNRVGSRAEDTSTFRVGSRSFTLEICADHNQGRAERDLGIKSLGAQAGADVQILVAHGSSLVKSALRPDGIAVFNDSTDLSKTDARAGEGAFRAVHRMNDSGRFRDTELSKVLTHDRLSDLYLGTHALPPPRPEPARNLLGTAWSQPHELPQDGSGLVNDIVNVLGGHQQQPAAPSPHSGSAEHKALSDIGLGSPPDSTRTMDWLHRKLGPVDPAAADRTHRLLNDGAPHSMDELVSSYLGHEGLDAHGTAGLVHAVQNGVHPDTVRYLYGNGPLTDHVREDLGNPPEWVNPKEFGRWSTGMTMSGRYDLLRDLNKAGLSAGEHGGSLLYLGGGADLEHPLFTTGAKDITLVSMDPDDAAFVNEKLTQLVAPEGRVTAKPIDGAPGTHYAVTGKDGTHVLDVRAHTQEYDDYLAGRPEPFDFVMDKDSWLKDWKGQDSDAVVSAIAPLLKKDGYWIGGHGLSEHEGSHSPFDDVTERIAGGPGRPWSGYEQLVIRQRNEGSVHDFEEHLRNNRADGGWSQVKSLLGNITEGAMLKKDDAYAVLRAEVAPNLQWLDPDVLDTGRLADKAADWLTRHVNDFPPDRDEIKAIFDLELGLET